MAAQAGARVPEIVTASLGSDGDAVVVTREPDIAPLESMAADQVSDETLDDLVQQVAKLHAAGISHGRLNASNVLVVEDGPMLVDLSAATLGAPQSSLDMDIAELLVACAILVGPDRALALAVKGGWGDAGWGDAVGRILPYLQPAALTPHLRDLARAHDVALKDLRQAAAQATGQDVPELVPLRRLRLRDLVATALVGVGAYLLISKLAKIGFGTIADQLRHAEVARIIVGLIFAQLAFVPGGVSFRGAVPAPLPLLPCAVLQSAIKFMNLTVPSSAGRIGINVRFLQRMGASTPEAFAAAAVDDLSVKIVQIALILLTLPFVHIAVKATDLKGGVPSGRLILAVLILLALIVVALLLIPAVRAKALPPVRLALSSLRAVARDRRKRLELFGGQLGVEVLLALTLGAACLAYGVHLTFAQLLLANSATSRSRASYPRPVEWGRRRRASRPLSPRWESTTPRPSRSPSRTGSARTTCRRSGGTSPCGGFSGRLMSERCNLSPMADCVDYPRIERALHMPSLIDMALFVVLSGVLLLAALIASTGRVAYIFAMLIVAGALGYAVLDLIGMEIRRKSRA
jgi:hypothetical protein